MRAMPRAAAKHAPAAQPVARVRTRAGFRQVWDPETKGWIEYRVSAPSLLDALLRDERIDADEFRAGLRFQNSFERAQLGPRYGTIALDAIRVDGGGKWHEPIGGSETARREIEAALEYVNGRGAESLLWLLGMGESVSAFTMRLRSAGRLVHERAVPFMLIVALGALVSFYRSPARAAA